MIRTPLRSRNVLLSPHAWSRRRFLRAAAGSIGGVVAAGLWMPRAALAAGSSAPKPIPGGFADFGHFYHVLSPGHPVFGVLGPDKEDPSAITDFNGHVGLAYVQGMGTHTDKTTGAVSQLPFEVDLRFMKGEYVGEDGRRRHDMFALI